MPYWSSFYDTDGRRLVTWNHWLIYLSHNQYALILDLTTLRAGNAYRRQWTGSSLFQAMALCQAIFWNIDGLFSIESLSRNFHGIWNQMLNIFFPQDAFENVLRKNIDHFIHTCTCKTPLIVCFSIIIFSHSKLGFLFKWGNTISALQLKP